MGPIFVDLTGASGTVYRFRTWSDAGRSPVAGHFAVVVRSKTGLQVQMLGITDRLSTAPQAVGSGSLETLFVRLNVSRASRQQNHADLLANYPTAAAFQAGP